MFWNDGEQWPLSRNNHQSICKAIARIFQDFTLDMYFRQFWQDPRLSFNEPGLEKLVVGAEYIKLIWVPDTFFVNEKTAYFHDATTENQFLRILHTGEILRSIRWVVPNSNWCIINLRQDGSLPTATINVCRSGYNSNKLYFGQQVQFDKTQRKKDYDRFSPIMF